MNSLMSYENKYLFHDKPFKLSRALKASSIAEDQYDFLAFDKAFLKDVNQTCRK